MERPSSITRLTVKNYRSVAQASLRFGELTFLVGRNGSGKSNLVDALSFVTTSLLHSPQMALAERDGFAALLHKCAGLEIRSFSLRIDFALQDGKQGHYAFEIAYGGDPSRGARIAREECIVTSAGGRLGFTRIGEHVIAFPSSIDLRLRADRLLLVSASGVEPYGTVFDLLSGMQFYNPLPTEMRGVGKYKDDPVLVRNGSNLAYVWGHWPAPLQAHQEVVLEYARQIMPTLVTLSVELARNHLILVAREDQPNAASPRWLSPEQLSDGSLRAIALLVGLFQPDAEGRRIPLVAVEEPESGLHPFAAGALRDALREASALRQVVVTSHSPDLLDDKDIAIESIYSVTMENGSTRVGPVDSSTRSIIRDGLSTAGEMMRQDHLQPELPAAEPEPVLFEEAGI